MKAILSAAASLLLGVYLVSYLRKSKEPTAPAPKAPKTAPAPKEASKEGVTMPTFDPNYPSTGVYKSDPANVDFHPSGFVTINGIAWTAAPLIDRKSGLFARLDQVQAEAWLKARGLRLIEESEWWELLKSPDALILKPCTLVHKASDQYGMRSLGFQKRHDDCVKKQLKAAAWDGRKLLINCGKQYLPDDRPNDGKQLEFGWFIKTANGAWKPIQTPGRAHENTYTDYSQLTMGRKV